MHKRPRNFVKTISDLDANICSGKVQVLEVLEATDDEAQKDYMVRVHFDMSVGSQFIPPVEMEMKENNESLDDLDDGNDGDDGDDGGDGAPTRKTAVKRKAPKKKKKTSMKKKKQRKSIPITSLDEEDPLQSPYSTGYTPTLEDFTTGYPPTPHDQFTPGYTPTPLEDMQHPPPPPHRTQSSFQQTPLPMSSQQEPRSRAPLTDVTDQSLHVKEVGTSVVKELPPTSTKDVAPIVEKEMDGSVLVSGDMRANVGTEESVDQSFFLELEDPNNWLSTDTKLNVEWKRIIEADKEAESSFDALGFDCPPDWIEYGCGDRSGWGQPWWLYTQLLIPCCVEEPDGYWILCKVDLLDHHISICDPTRAKKKSNHGERYKQVMPLRRLLPSIMNKCGFYSNKGKIPRGSMFSVGRQITPHQVDSCSCGVFICKYAETAIVKSADWNWGQKDMPKFRKEIAFDIYNNSVTFKSPIDL
ncbi:hypothetical protein LWI29_020875 [Acer saccharum]|uniref:Ubiquitin-like protease family profile domain-containing protein n=1 Tax=Acer saccharum TaxID=4024 RepID=A0AA39W397_ACESA|nr:hypothetical protein LWI29_020875 [Acer saccharum]